MKVTTRILMFAILAFTASSAFSAQFVRWTYKDDANSDINHIVEKLAQATGITLNVSDFSLDEDRDLAFNHYQRYSQSIAGVKVRGMGIRVWTGADKQVLQVEALVDQPAATVNSRDFRFASSRVLGRSGTLATSQLLSSQVTINLVRVTLSRAEDNRLTGITWNDYWLDQRLVREVRAKARHGYHLITISLVTGRLISKTYVPYPQGDHSIAAKVFPIYEEYKGQILERVDVTLSGIAEQVARPTADPYTPMRDRHYYYSKYDPARGETEEGRAEGYWSEAYLRRQAKELSSVLPKSTNDFSGEGMLLQGQYVTINIHPDAFNKFSGIEFPALHSPGYMPRWIEVPATEGQPADYEIVPGAAFFGKRLQSADAALNRPATRHPEHDPVTYINEGFDEIQVYYAVNRLFEALKPKGFTDPDLSTRAFNAYLYDPDIAYRDNAYYTSDTINFTTYSPGEQNAARDNGTIWHELGHGIMDRLMGDFVRLADTGGLSEGMADFVAALVVSDVTRGTRFPGDQDMRIINRTGFYLTNEVHDDGEAYGGTMRDMLVNSIATWGQEAGLAMITDLTLEAMRLTRDHPALTADDWFSHMLFADELGRPGLREPGQMHDVIQGALESRNFAAAEADRALFSMVYNDNEIIAGKPGSRDNELPLSIKEDETANYEITTTVKSSENYKFKYPVEVRVYLQTGPLQGAVHWVGEENTYLSYKIENDGDSVKVPLTVTGKCDRVNREDGSCSDFAYVQLWNAGEDRPVAKKRFYVRLKTLTSEQN